MASKINKSKVIAAAQKHVQKGNYDKAIREYSKIVEEDPRDVRIWLKIGDLYAKKNATSEAVDTYSKVAEFYAEQGFYLKAVAVYKQILRLDTTLVDINLRLAELYKQLGLLSDAMQQYERVSGHFHKAGRTKEALASLRQIVDLDPENVASRIKLAELYSKESMREDAIEEFSKAADFLRADNRIDDFVKVAERLIYHQPDNIALTKEIASIYLRRNDPRRALQKLQLAFKADPRDTDSLEMLAQAFENLGQIAKTVSVYKELANIYGANGKPNKQQEIYQRLLQIAPNDPEIQALLEKAPAYSHQVAASPAQPPPPTNHAPVAAQPPSLPSPPLPPPSPPSPPSNQPAQPIMPPDSEPEGVTEPRSEQRQYSPGDGPIQALKTETGTESGPSVPEIQAEITKVLAEADVYVKYGLHEKAIDHLLQLLHRQPENADLRVKLKDVYLQQGYFNEASHELYLLGEATFSNNPTRAAEFLNEAVELDPENDQARNLLRQLEGYTEDTETSSPAITDEEFEQGDSIALDFDDIVEEIPLSASDLQEATDLSPLDEAVEVNTHPGPNWPNTNIEDEEEFSRELPAHEEITEGSGIIQVIGETTNTIGMGTPASEIIPIGIESEQTDSNGSALEEEHATKIEDDLEEADFFLQQNLFAEARAILTELQQLAPDNRLVQEKIAEVDAAISATEQTQSESLDLSQESATQLAADLAVELDEIDLRESTTQTEATFSVEDVFDEVKRGDETSNIDEDSDTHYDLGIAYREMGLIDDAITEFKIAMRAPDKEVLCHMMIGLCFLEKEMLSEAISQFKTGLYVENITPRETIALYFELGQAYERLGDQREALYYYEKVSKKDPTFRQVAKVIAKINAASDNANASHDANSRGSSGRLSKIG